jgi:hypothetical protein
MTSRRISSLALVLAGTWKTRAGKTSPPSMELRTTSPGAALTKACGGKTSATRLRATAAGAATASSQPSPVSRAPAQSQVATRASMTSGALAT